MRIGYFGDGPWSHEALAKILQSGDFEIAFITARHGSADPVLRRYAEQLGVGFWVHPNVNAPDFLEQVVSARADLLVSMSFDQILGPGILAAAPLGFINCHAGALPFYRGRNILNWVLINGESRFGVTVHRVDTGIDTGDIILQRFAEIGPEDDYGSVLTQAVSLCAETLFDALVLLKKGQAPRVSQATIHPVGTYCSRRGAGDEWLDWNWPSVRVHNFVRALASPGPGARTHGPKGELAIWRTELIAGAPVYLDKPGAIVGRGRGHVVVKTGDSSIRVSLVGRVAEAGIPAAPESPKFSIGTQLASELAVRVRDLERRLRMLEETHSAARAGGTTAR